MNGTLRYRLPHNYGILTFSHPVLAHFERHKQHRIFSREAGGQLFATFADPAVMDVIDITGPRPTDRRSFCKYEPDRIAEKAEIRNRFSLGRHFVGDWHTHRQHVPVPSNTDLRSISELVQHSAHDLAGFILVVVGQAAFPLGIHISFHSKSESTTLTPMADDEHQAL